MGATAEFVDQHPNTVRALGMAMFDAAKFIDAQANRAKGEEIIASPGYLAVAKRINRIELYRQAAAQVNVAVPDEAMRSSTLTDDSIKGVSIVILPVIK